jgi:hypothetical protein
MSISKGIRTKIGREFPNQTGKVFRSSSSFKKTSNFQ